MYIDFLNLYNLFNPAPLSEKYLLAIFHIFYYKGPSDLEGVKIYQHWK